MGVLCLSPIITTGKTVTLTVACLGILRMVAWGHAPVFQKTRATRGIKGLLRFNLQYNYCHDAPKRATVQGMYNLNLTL